MSMEQLRHWVSIYQRRGRRPCGIDMLSRLTWNHEFGNDDLRSVDREFGYRYGVPDLGGIRRPYRTAYVWLPLSRSGLRD